MVLNKTIKREVKLENLNKDWFLAINSYAGNNHIVDVIITAIAQYTPYLFIVGLFYLWFTNKKNEALFAGYATTLGIIINLLIGLAYYHPRPYMQNLGHTLLAHKNDGSFPSDHTTFLFSIAFMLITFRSTRKLGNLAILLSFACGIARVYSGVHWPYDIIGSIIVSIVAVALMHVFKNRLVFLNKIIISSWTRIFGKRK